MNVRLRSCYLALVILGVLLGSCSSGKRALQRGDYAEAIDQAVNRLRQAPKNRKARSTLRKAYPLARNFYENQVAQHRNSQSPRKWENILYNYRILNQIYLDIQRCPACLKLIPKARNYQSEADAARQKAAHARYELGKQAMAQGSRESAKGAYQHFLAAKNLLNTYPKIDQAIMEAKEAATVQVILEKVPVYSQRYRISDEYFSNKMFEFLRANRRMSEFVEFYTPSEAVSQRLNQPDHVIQMQFDDFNVGQTYVKESSETIKRDSVVVGQVNVDSEERDVYGSVKATMTTFRKTVASNGVLDLKVYDARTKQLVSQEKFQGEFVWESEWGNYRGDERALTREQLEICELSEVSPPPAEDLFIEFSKPIYGRVTKYIRRFYRDY